MFNWWPLMWKKTHRAEMARLLRGKSPMQEALDDTRELNRRCAEFIGSSNPILDDMQPAQDCDAVMKAARKTRVEAEYNAAINKFNETMKGVVWVDPSKVKKEGTMIKPGEWVRVGNISGKKNPRSGKRITSGSKKRRR